MSELSGFSVTSELDKKLLLGVFDTKDTKVSSAPVESQQPVTSTKLSKLKELSVIRRSDVKRSEVERSEVKRSVQDACSDKTDHRLINL